MDDEDYGYKVLIWCRREAPGHRKKGVVVAAFVFRGEGRWDQSVVGGHRRDWMTSWNSGDLKMMTWVDGEAKYELVCPACAPGRTPHEDRFGDRKGSTIPLGEKLLFEILNGARHAGLHELEISQVRAIIQHRTQAV